MKFFRIKFFVGTLVIFLLLGFSYRYRGDMVRILPPTGFLNQAPCQKPITYSIANIDPRFGLTEAELLNIVKQSEEIWESPINKQLFEYSPMGNLKINLIYDNRQGVIDSLRKIGTSISDDQSAYNIIKTKYDSLVVSYDKAKAQLEVLIATYNADKSAYESDVIYWNSRGGAPKAEHDALEQRRVALNNQVAKINQTEDSFNGIVENINSTRTELNKLAATLNIQVNTYNNVGSSNGKEFGEGEYVKDASGTAINIFQFDDKNQLEIVLAHELGHALGLAHVDNSKAIMFYLINKSIEKKLTKEDLAALVKVCGGK
ncbi:MAG: M57 family metalloprotease [bacterium]|nr:M57 family metalloprotease [bacterium]